MSSDLSSEARWRRWRGWRGTCATRGADLSLMIGGWWPTVGYTPFFALLGVLDLVGAAVLWTLVRGAPREWGGRGALTCRARRHPQPILRGFTPTRRSCASATTTTSPPRRRMVHRRVQIHTRAISCRRLLTRRSRGPARSTCGATRTRAGYGRRASPRDGLFHLIYTDVKTLRAHLGRRRLRRFPARLPQLPGHEPAHLGRLVRSRLPQQHGFAPSLFHDDDGRKYL